MTITIKSNRELADLIDRAIHPSTAEPGPVPDGSLVRDRSGAMIGWADRRLTRLETPASATGFGLRWIDYDTAAEAADARERARKAVLDAPEGEGFAALDAFIKAE